MKTNEQMINKLNIYTFSLFLALFFVFIDVSYAKNYIKSVTCYYKKSAYRNIYKSPVIRWVIDIKDGKETVRVRTNMMQINPLTDMKITNKFLDENGKIIQLEAFGSIIKPSRVFSMCVIQNVKWTLSKFDEDMLYDVPKKYKDEYQEFWYMDSTFHKSFNLACKTEVAEVKSDEAKREQQDPEISVMGEESRKKFQPENDEALGGMNWLDYDEKCLVSSSGSSLSSSSDSGSSSSASGNLGSSSSGLATTTDIVKIHSGGN